MSELQGQLSRHRAEHRGLDGRLIIKDSEPGAGGRSKVQGYCSLIFTVKEALQIDVVENAQAQLWQNRLCVLISHELRSRAVESFDTLVVSVDPGLLACADLFDMGLESPAYLRKKRSFMTQDEANALDALLERFLDQVGPYWQQEECLYCLEYLIRRYSIQRYNAHAFLCMALPQHGTQLFVRVVQMIELPPNSPFQFLEKVRRTGLPVARSLIVENCVRNPAVLSFLNAATLRSASELPTPNVALISFFTACCVEAIGSASFQPSELFLRQLIPSVFFGLQNPMLPDMHAASLCILSQLSRKTSLSRQLCNAVVVDLFLAILKRVETPYHKRTALWGAFLFLNSLLLDQAARPQETVGTSGIFVLPRAVLQQLVKLQHRRDVLPVLKSLSNASSRFDISPLLGVLFRSIFSECQRVANKLDGFKRAAQAFCTEFMETFLDHTTTLKERVALCFSIFEALLRSPSVDGLPVMLLRHLESVYPTVVTTAVRQLAVVHPPSLELHDVKEVSVVRRVVALLCDVLKDTMEDGSSNITPINNRDLLERFSLWCTLTDPCPRVRHEAVRVALAKVVSSADPTGSHMAGGSGARRLLFQILQDRSSDKHLPIALEVLRCQELWQQCPASEALAHLYSQFYLLIQYAAGTYPWESSEEIAENTVTTVSALLLWRLSSNAEVLLRFSEILRCMKIVVERHSSENLKLHVYAALKHLLLPLCWAVGHLGPTEVGAFQQLCVDLLRLTEALEPIAEPRLLYRGDVSKKGTNSAVEKVSGHLDGGSINLHAVAVELFKCAEAEPSETFIGFAALGSVTVVRTHHSKDSDKTEGVELIQVEPTAGSTLGGIWKWVSVLEARTWWASSSCQSGSFMKENETLPDAACFSVCWEIWNKMSKGNPPSSTNRDAKADSETVSGFSLCHAMLRSYLLGYGTHMRNLAETMSDAERTKLFRFLFLGLSGILSVQDVGTLVPGNVALPAAAVLLSGRSFDLCRESESGAYECSLFFSSFLDDKIHGRAREGAAHLMAFLLKSGAATVSSPVDVCAVFLAILAGLLCENHNAQTAVAAAAVLKPLAKQVGMQQSSTMGKLSIWEPLLSCSFTEELFEVVYNQLVKEKFEVGRFLKRFSKELSGVTVWTPKTVLRKLAEGNPSVILFLLLVLFSTGLSELAREACDLIPLEVEPCRELIGLLFFPLFRILLNPSTNQIGRGDGGGAYQVACLGVKLLGQLDLSKEAAALAGDKTVSKKRGKKSTRSLATLISKNLLLSMIPQGAARTLYLQLLGVLLNQATQCLESQTLAQLVYHGVKVCVAWTDRETQEPEAQNENTRDGGKDTVATLRRLLSRSPVVTTAVWETVLLHYLPQQEWHNPEVARQLMLVVDCIKERWGSMEVDTDSTGHLEAERWTMVAGLVAGLTIWIESFPPELIQSEVQGSVFCGVLRGLAFIGTFAQKDLADTAIVVNASRPWELAALTALQKVHAILQRKDDTPAEQAATVAALTTSALDLVLCSLQKDSLQQEREKGICKKTSNPPEALIEVYMRDVVAIALKRIPDLAEAAPLSTAFVRHLPDLVGVPEGITCTTLPTTAIVTRSTLVGVHLVAFQVTRAWLASGGRCLQERARRLGAVLGRLLAGCTATLPTAVLLSVAVGAWAQVQTEQDVEFEQPDRCLSVLEVADKDQQNGSCCSSEEWILTVCSSFLVHLSPLERQEAIFLLFQGVAGELARNAMFSDARGSEPEASCQLHNFLAAKGQRVRTKTLYTLLLLGERVTSSEFHPGADIPDGLYKALFFLYSVRRCKPRPPLTLSLLQPLGRLAERIAGRLCNILQKPLDPLKIVSAAYHLFKQWNPQSGFAAEAFAETLKLVRTRMLGPRLQAVATGESHTAHTQGLPRCPLSAWEFDCCMEASEWIEECIGDLGGLAVHSQTDDHPAVFSEKEKHAPSEIRSSVEDEIWGFVSCAVLYYGGAVPEAFVKAWLPRLIQALNARTVSPKQIRRLSTALFAGTHAVLGKDLLPKLSGIVEALVGVWETSPQVALIGAYALLTSPSRDFCTSYMETFVKTFLLDATMLLSVLGSKRSQLFGGVFDSFFSTLRSLLGGTSAPGTSASLHPACLNNVLLGELLAADMSKARVLKETTSSHHGSETHGLTGSSIYLSEQIIWQQLAQVVLKNNNQALRQILKTLVSDVKTEAASVAKGGDALRCSVALVFLAETVKDQLPENVTPFHGQLATALVAGYHAAVECCGSEDADVAQQDRKASAVALSAAFAPRVQSGLVEDLLHSTASAADMTQNLGNPLAVIDFSSSRFLKKREPAILEASLGVLLRAWLPKMTHSYLRPLLQSLIKYAFHEGSTFVRKSDAFEVDVTPVLKRGEKDASAEPVLNRDVVKARIFTLLFTIIAVDLKDLGIVSSLWDVIPHLKYSLLQSHRNAFALAMTLKDKDGSRRESDGYTKESNQKKKNRALERSVASLTTSWWWLDMGLPSLLCLAQVVRVAPSASLVEQLAPIAIEGFDVFSVIGRPKIVSNQEDTAFEQRQTTTEFLAFVSTDNPGDRLAQTWFYASLMLFDALVTAVAEETLKLRHVVQLLLEKIQASRNPDVRMALVCALQGLWHRQGLRFLPTLNDSLHIFVELLEDNDEMVERRTQSLIQAIEALTGESLRSRLTR